MMHEKVKVKIYTPLSKHQGWRLPCHQLHLLAFKEVVSWKAPKIKRFPLIWLISGFRAICLTVCLCQRREYFWLSCSCERERLNAAEAGRNMDFVKTINTSSKSITPCACSRTRFQPVNQVADGPCNNTQAPVLRWEIYFSFFENILIPESQRYNAGITLTSTTQCSNVSFLTNGGLWW